MGAIMWNWFSDWGVASEYEDLDAATTQAEFWLEQVAEERDWTTEQTDYGLLLITQAAGDSSTAQGFWTNLATGWAAAKAMDVAGWDDLTSVWTSAVGTAQTVADSREEGSIETVLSSTLDATVQDLNPYADTIKGAALGALVGAAGLGGTALVIDKKSAIMGVQSGAVLGALAGAWWTWPNA